MEGQEDVSGPVLHPSAGTRSGDVAKHVRKTIGHGKRERTQTGKMSWRVLVGAHEPEK